MLELLEGNPGGLRHVFPRHLAQGQDQSRSHAMMSSELEETGKIDAGAKYLRCASEIGFRTHRQAK